MLCHNVIYDIRVVGSYVAIVWKWKPGLLRGLIFGIDWYVCKHPIGLSIVFDIVLIDNRHLLIRHWVRFIVKNTKTFQITPCLISNLPQFLYISLLT